MSGCTSDCFSVSIAVNNLIYGLGGSIHALIPGVPVSLLRRLDVVTIMISIPLFVRFIQAYYDRPRSHVGRVIVWLALTCIGLAIVLPNKPLDILFQWFFVVIVMMIVWSVHIGIAAVRAGHSDAGWILTGLLAMSAAGLNDVFWGLGLLQTVVLVPVAALLLSLIHSVLISKRFAQAFAASEKLAMQLLENQRLREEMDTRMRREELLRNEHHRLSRLLHTIDIPLCVVDENDMVEFCNQAFETMSGQTLAQLRGKPIAECVNMDAHRGETSCSMLDYDDEQLKVYLFDVAAAAGKKNRAPVDFIMAINRNRERVRALNRLVTEWDPQFVQRHPELARELESIDHALYTIATCRHDTDTAQEERALACKLMNQIIEYWQSCTGKSKYELAQESGVWKVHVNPDGWERTQTLDRYLDIGKFPKNLRWSRIFMTADFVLRRCTAQSSLRSDIENGLSSLAACTSKT